MKRGQHILFFTAYYTTPDEPGLLRSWQVANHLAGRGHRVTVVTTGTNYMTGKTSKAACRLWTVEEHGERLRVIRVWTPGDYRRSILGRLLYSLGLAVLGFAVGLGVDHPDVVLGATPPPTVPPFALLLARLRGARFVEEVRDMQTEDALEMGYLREGTMVRWHLALEQWAYRGANAIVAVTPGIKKIIAAKGIPEGKITVVPNGYEEVLFEDDTSPLNREALGWREYFVVLYSGSMGQTVDLWTLFGAAKLLREERKMLFVLLGDGERRGAYEKFCRDEGVNACFLGALSRKKVTDYCRCADVGVSLHGKGKLWDHVLGNKTFDYLGSGLPMVYAGSGDTDDLLRQSRGGISVPAEDPEALRDALLEMAGSPERCREMGREGQAFVREHFARRGLLEDLEQVLLSCVGIQKGDC